MLITSIHFNEIPAEKFATFAAACSAGETLGKSIVVSSALPVEDDLTVDRSLVIKQGGRLEVASGKTLTINGPFQAGLSQCFFGDGSVTGLRQAKPHWFYSGSGSWASAFQKAFDSGAHRVDVPEGIYDFGTESVTQQTAGSGLDGVALVGLSTYHTTKIIYTGSGYAINYIGEGVDAVTSVSRFYIENIWISGSDSANPIGALNVSRTFIVDINRCQFSDFAQSGGKILNIRNTFNAHLRNSQISGSYPDTSAADGLVVGSESPDAWNTSNVQIRNCLIQRTNVGLKVIQDANVFDNLSVDNTSFGSNNCHIYANSANIYELVLTNNHFEDCSSGTGVDLRNMSGVNVSDNYFQNALINLYLEDVDGFMIARNKIQNPVAIPGDTAIKLNVVDGNCRGKMSWNAINTNEVTTPYNIHASVRVTSDTPFASESAWGFYSANPKAFGTGSFVQRYERDLYNRTWTAPDSSTWLRLLMSGRDYSETTSGSVPTDGAPFTSGATITAGTWVRNISPSIRGTGGYATTNQKYIVLGWYRITTGTGHVLNTDWVEMRILTGQ